MSNAVFTRAINREQTIWLPFVYSHSFSTEMQDERVIIFGLYAGTYKYGHSYLKEIEAEDLLRLVNIYDKSMAQLTMEEQSLVLEMAAKRYIFAIEQNIKAEQLTTKGRQLNAGEQELGAKVIALEADREVLDTKRIQIEITKEKIVARNKELQAKIDIEALNQQYVSVEISEKELAVAQAELDIVLAGLRALDVQVAIARMSLEIVRAEASKSQFIADTALTDAKIAQAELTANRLGVEEKELEAIEYEVENVADKRIESIEARGETIGEETTAIMSEQTNEAALQLAQTTQQIARTAAIMQANGDRQTSAETVKDIDIDSSNLGPVLAGEHAQTKVAIAAKRGEVDAARRAAAAALRNDGVAAANTLARADIVTTLVHSIGT